MIISEDITEFKVERIKFSDKFFSFIKFRFVRDVARTRVVVTFEDGEMFTKFPKA